MACQIPNGCILHEQSGYCPLCDEDGADKIAEWQQEEDSRRRAAEYERKNRETKS